MSYLRIASTSLFVSLLATQAFAACPIELGVYGDRDGVATLEFRPKQDSAAVTNQFRMVMKDGPVFDGVVLWTTGVERPNGILMHDCPEGDVTGEELAACTLWQGVIYARGAAGIDLLPAQGSDAPDALVLADLGHSMQSAPAFAASGLTVAPFDVFELEGCQE